MIIKTLRQLLLSASLFVAIIAQAQTKILFDASKAESAGNADWVADANVFNLCFNPNANTGCGGTEANAQGIPSPAQSGITANTLETFWKGGLSAFAVDAVKKGYTVETLPYNGLITFGNSANAKDLSLYKTFVVCEPNIVFTSVQKTAIINWVAAGGSLLMIADHNVSDRNNDGWDSPHIWNDLMNNNAVAANPFGITFDYADFSQTSSNVVTTANPITQGPQGNVTQMKFSGGTSITINTSANSNVKGMVFKTGASKTGSTNIMVAYSKYGSGRIVAIGDSSPSDDGTGDTNDILFNGYTGEAGGNHKKLLLNSLLWLQGATNVSVDGASNKLVGGIGIAPNPANEMVNISLDPTYGFEGISIVDMQGKVCYAQDWESESLTDLSVDTNTWANGLYILRLIGEHGIKTEKLVVQH